MQNVVVHCWFVDLQELPPEQLSVLSPPERARAARFVREIDRARFALGAWSVRAACQELGGAAAEAVAVRRVCVRCGDADHGRPILPGTGWHVSVTHAGGWVGVALCAAQVGLDVEPYSTTVEPVLGRLVAGAEGTEGAAGNVGPRATLEGWTRKEAVLKATGDGLTVPVAKVRLGGGPSPRTLLAYPGRPGLRATVADIAPDGAHAGAVAVLSRGPIEVRTRSFSSPFRLQLP